ncbi:phosphate ABC transporter permease PstA [Thermodesulfovibrionales bacterium]|nr:phosphate ABC transporter permease PstA [Thermodesulfovibrionales bacterium]
MKARKIKELISFTILRLATVAVLLALFIILHFIMSEGIRVINWEFLTEGPRDMARAGGIFPAILGTFYTVVGTMAIVLPLGVGASIYLTEYATQGRVIRALRVGINNLAGVPSVVFGLFGFTVFVVFFGFGASILSICLTMAVLTLPIIIRSSEEALKAIPQSFREASLALGATKWQTIYKVVLPHAFSGISTGSVLGASNVAGETAPILFVGATFFMLHLPDSIFDETMLLSFHIYALLTEGIFPHYQIPIAYGTALVLITLVLGVNLAAIVIRNRIRKKKKW